MKLHFNFPYFITFIILLIIEVAIAVYLSEGFIRSSFGDFLVVMLIYYAIRSFLNTKPIYVVISVLLFAYTIEFLQLFHLLELFHLQNNMTVKTILGNTFQISDLIAYTLGIIAILITEYKILPWVSKH